MSQEAWEAAMGMRCYAGSPAQREGIYKAHEDKRSAFQQIKDGWFLKYHPKTGEFYTYDPANEADTFGSRGLSKQKVRNMVKNKELQQVGVTGEVFKMFVSAENGDKQ